VSGIGLLFVSPVLLLVAILIRLDSPGPVFYRGTRAGLKGKPFRIFKFRSMKLDADKGASSTPADDLRITRVGRILRRYKLDELPQLLDVLIGNMSMVGPRPQVLWVAEAYSPEDREVLQVRPGITDFASLRFANEGEILRGSADPDKDYYEKIHPEKMRLARDYVRHHNVFIDIRILCLTVCAILFGNPHTTPAGAANENGKTKSEVAGEGSS
jgi:lipopolysaccharide/colanic/teichoic acid biosynthesis glycosyltransferase